MASKLLKTPFVFACFVLIIYMMRHNDLSVSKGLRSSFRLLHERVLQSTRPSESLCSGITIEETYSAKEIEKAQEAKGPMGSKLREWALNGSDDTLVEDVVVPMIALFAPWPILAVITLFTCFGFVCNWCCIFGCCKNCCKGCKCCKQNKQQSKMKFYMAISSVFLLATLGAAAAGLAHAPKVSKGMNLTFCTALVSMENLVFGETSQEWMGFNTILLSLYNVRTQFTTTVTSLNAIGGSQTAFDTAHTNAVNANAALYTNNNGVTVRRADQIQGTTYTPDYIANLGPVATDNTYTYLIKTELDAWHTIIAAAISGINSAVNSLKTQQSAIESAIDTGIDTAQSINSSLNDVIDSLDDVGDSVKDGVKAAGAVLIALFAVNLSFAVIAVLSIILLGTKKIRFFSKILHFSWCIINLMTLLGFIIATLTLPVSVIMLGSCEIFQSTLNDQDFFDTITSKLFTGDSSDAKNILNTCFYGSGKALDELGLTNQLEFFDTIYNELDSVNGIIDLSGTYTNANPPPSVVIPLQQTLVSQTLSGALPDKDVTVADLQTLNQGSNSASHSCVSFKDMWMLGGVTCTDSSYHKFLNSNNNARDGLPGLTCIGFDEWISPNSFSINTRYDTTNFPTSCTNPDLSRVQALVNGFVTNRNDVKTAFTNINTDLTNVASKQRTFSQEVVGFIQSIQNVKSNVAAIKDSLVGEANGLIPNTNCQFIGNDLRNIQVAMCASLGSSLYQASVAMIVMCVMSFLATIFTFILAKRFSIKSGDKAVSPTNGHNGANKIDPFTPM